MSIPMLLVLIGLAWASYPLAGAATVAAEVLDGKRPAGAGFSFLPELVVFPAAFFGVAALGDHLAMPWGRRIVGGICALMIAGHMYLFLRSLRRMRAAKETAARPGDAADLGRHP